MLGMRTTNGISERDYRIRCQSNWKPIDNVLKAFEEKGWTEKTEEGRWHFTVPGYLISNTLIGIMLEAQAGERVEGNPWLAPALEDEEKIDMPKGEDELFKELYRDNSNN